MRILKYFFLLLLLALVGVTVFVSTQKGEYSIEKSRVIKSPRAVVYSYVGDLRDWENFSAWFRRHDPDVVLGHQIETMKWMTACGASIPKTHGFFCLNLIMTRAPCAGFNQLPDFIGARAIDIVTAQLYRNEFGVPKRGVLTTIPSLFVEGPTIRTIPPPRARRA